MLIYQRFAYLLLPVYTCTLTKLFLYLQQFTQHKLNTVSLIRIHTCTLIVSCEQMLEIEKLEFMSIMPKKKPNIQTSIIFMSSLETLSTC